jgi:hypothetical protein
MSFVEHLLVDIFIFVLGMSTLISVTRLASKLIERRKMPGGELRAIEERLARIEQTTDSTAIEVERVSEGLRFNTKLLAERAGAQVPPPPPSLPS